MILNAVGNAVSPVFIFPRARFHDTVFGAPLGSIPSLKLGQDMNTEEEKRQKSCILTNTPEKNKMEVKDDVSEVERNDIIPKLHQPSIFGGTVHTQALMFFGTDFLFQ
jgi:hypothetical protein